MTNSPGALPGAYNFHSSPRPTGAPPRMSGAKSHIFQPPRTPTASASSSLILSRSTTSIISNTTSIAHAGQRNVSGSRKRTLNDYNDVETPETVSWSRMVVDDCWEKDPQSLSAYGEPWTPSSPRPFVNTRYQLAGGMDTPHAAESRMEDTVGGEPAFRKSLSDMDEKKYDASLQRENGTDDGYFALQREGNGRARGAYPDQRANGWSKGAISLVGTVVGKAWEFCKASATVFTGFRAGGGQAYTNEFDSVARFEAAENQWESEKQYYDFQSQPNVSTPLPGRYPGDDFSYIYHDEATPDDSPARPTKRRQVSGGFRDEDIAKNWVVVQNTSTPPIQSQTRQRPALRPSNSYLSRQSLQQVNSRPTSRASMLPTSRPASRASLAAPTTNPRRSLATRGSHAGSQALNPVRGASFASPRSPATSRIPRASPSRNGSPVRSESRTSRLPLHKQQEESPAAREAKKWKAAMRREEREADESIRRLDAQLKAMIREGKEALGTTIEVLSDDDDDGNVFGR